MKLRPFSKTQPHRRLLATSIRQMLNIPRNGLPLSMSQVVSATFELNELLKETTGGVYCIVLMKHGNQAPGKAIIVNDSMNWTEEGS